jgi:hypothetical protein
VTELIEELWAVRNGLREGHRRRAEAKVYIIGGSDRLAAPTVRAEGAHFRNDWLWSAQGPSVII